MVANFHQMPEHRIAPHQREYVDHLKSGLVEKQKETKVLEQHTEAVGTLKEILTQFE